MKEKDNLEDFILKFPELPEKIIRGTLFDLTSAIIKDTPVDTGRLRGNWMASINRKRRTKTETTDSNGGKTIERAKAVIKRFKMGNTYFLSNNLPYAKKIEYGGSQQSPRGMARINVARAQRMIDKYIRQYDK